MRKIETDLLVENKNLFVWIPKQSVNFVALVVFGIYIYIYIYIYICIGTCTEKTKCIQNNGKTPKPCFGMGENML